MIHSLQDLAVGVMMDQYGWSSHGQEVSVLVKDEGTSMVAARVAPHYVGWHSTVAGGNPSRLVASCRRYSSWMVLVAGSVNGSVPWQFHLFAGLAHSDPHPSDNRARSILLVSLVHIRALVLWPVQAPFPTL